MTGYLSGCDVSSTPLLARDRLSSMLTFRERQTALLARHHSSREIAQRLGLSLHTVNNYLARAYAKLGVRSRNELTAAIESD
jgi:DNA-binding CsgD family transcriptional regulator